MRDLYFVKGHCGWDVLSLLLAEEIPVEEQLATALKVLDPPVSGGLEVGLLSRTSNPGELRLRITDSTTRQWLAMCGGMTQVIGKALIETAMREYFAIDVSQPVVNVRLVTDECVIPLRIEIANGRATRVLTNMDSYLDLTYRLGLRDVSIDGVRGLEAGEYLILHLDELHARYPDVDFTRRDPGPHLEIVNALLAAHRRKHGDPLYSNAMLYDSRPEGSGQFRIFPRFLDPTASAIPYEFQCGTGTIALAVALAHEDALARDVFTLEWGSQRTTPDPYGIRTSRVEVTRRPERLTSAAFSHSVIDIAVEGRVRIA